MLLRLALLLIGLAAVAVVLLAILARPTFVGAQPFDHSPFDLVAVVGVLVGGVWLVRAYRGEDPERGPSPWRYRDR